MFNVERGEGGNQHLQRLAKTADRICAFHWSCGVDSPRALPSFKPGSCKKIWQVGKANSDRKSIDNDIGSCLNMAVEKFPNSMEKSGKEWENSQNGNAI